MGPALDGPLELKAFRSRGLVRRVTPFIGAGLIALVVFTDPNFSRLPWADALASTIVTFRRAPPFACAIPLTCKGNTGTCTPMPTFPELLIRMRSVFTTFAEPVLKARPVGTEPGVTSPSVVQRIEPPVRK